jgi:hypothetical protein
VFNHNVETVARLQRAVRPSRRVRPQPGRAGRAKAAGLTTKTGFMLGLGETFEEIEGCCRPAAIGTDIVTIGQYLRPTTNHLPVARWVPSPRSSSVEAARRVARHRPRRGQPAHPQQLPRPAQAADRTSRHARPSGPSARAADGIVEYWGQKNQTSGRRSASARRADGGTSGHG